MDLGPKRGVGAAAAHDVDRGVLPGSGSASTKTPLSVAQQILLAAQTRRRGPNEAPSPPPLTARPRLVSTSSTSSNSSTESETTANILNNLIAAAKGKKEQRPKRSYAMRAMLAGIGEEEEVAVMESSYHKLMQTMETSPNAPVLAMSVGTDDADEDTLRAGQRGPMQRSELLPAHDLMPTAALATLCYFLMCGGPVGSEPTLSTAGPLFGILGFLVFPIVFTLPILKIVVELATTFPQDGGVAAWTKNASGTFWGFSAGYGMWITSVFDRALYAKLAVDYVFPGVDSGTRFGVEVGAAFLLTIPSLMRGQVLVRAMYGLLAVVATFTLISSIWEFSKARTMFNFGQLRTESITFASNDTTASPVFSGPLDIDWGAYLHAFFWNYDGATFLAIVTNQLTDPVRTYHRAIMFSGLMGLLSYMIPAFAAVSDNRPHWTRWSGDTTYAIVADNVGGGALRVLVTIAAVAGLAGMFFSETLCERVHIAGMAQATLLPSQLRQRESRVPALISLVIVLIALPVHDEALLRIRNALSAITQLILLVTFLRLRHLCPALPRPSKLPGHLCVVYLMLLVPLCVLVTLVMTTAHSPPRALALVLIGAVGAIAGLVRRRQYMAPPLSAGGE